MITIRSRIKEFISDQVMDDLYKICKKRSISDNNKKVRLIEEALTAHNVDYVMLGPGTNRVAVLIDNYVFKIAMDDWGVRDNRNEFTNSNSLQPFVVKTYETNGLISVCEYVTLITREEFEENREGIIAILSILGESYLLGDVGYAPKNFTNWGYRDNGDLVILDFAYIYQISNDIILCSDDHQILEYNQNFTSMQCPRCHRKYSFMDLRRRIPKEYEQAMNEIDLEDAYALTTPKIVIDEEDEEELEQVRITRKDVMGTQDSEQQCKVEGERNEGKMDKNREYDDGLSAYDRIMNRLEQTGGNPLAFNENVEDVTFEDHNEENDTIEDIEDAQRLVQDVAVTAAVQASEVVVDALEDIKESVRESEDDEETDDYIIGVDMDTSSDVSVDEEIDNKDEAVIDATEEAEELIEVDVVTPDEDGPVFISESTDEDEDLLAKAFGNLGGAPQEDIIVEEEPLDKYEQMALDAGQELDTDPIQHHPKRRDWTI